MNRPGWMPERVTLTHYGASDRMIELETLAARLDAGLAELHDQAATWEHETRNPAYALATKAERALETVRAVQEEGQPPMGASKEEVFE